MVCISVYRYTYHSTYLCCIISLTGDCRFFYSFIISIEFRKTIKTRIGVIYFRINKNNPIKLPLFNRSLFDSSRRSDDISAKWPASSDINRPPKGSKTFEEIKSNKSKKLFPAITVFPKRSSDVLLLSLLKVL